MIYKIPEIQGYVGRENFLHAVRKRIAPSWATRKLEENIEKDRFGEHAPDLKALGKILAAFLYYHEVGKKTGTTAIFVIPGMQKNPQKQQQTA